MGEVSHDYLFSPRALERIHHDLANVRLMVSLREPVDRAFSSYLYMIRQGRVRGSFEDALERHPELIDHGRYAKHLLPCLHTFGRERVHVAIFDDLKQRPQEFVDDLTGFLGVRRMLLTNVTRQEALIAARPRSWFIAKAARSVGAIIRAAGWPTIVEQVKSNDWVQSVLYKPYNAGDKPTLQESTRTQLRSLFASELEQLDEALGLELRARWGYWAEGTQEPI